MSRDTQPRCDACGNELGRALPSYKRYGDAGKLLSFCDAYCNGRYDERQIAISAEDARRILNWNMLYGGQGHLAFDLQAMLRTRTASLSVSPVPPKMCDCDGLWNSTEVYMVSEENQEAYHKTGHFPDCPNYPAAVSPVPEPSEPQTIDLTKALVESLKKRSIAGDTPK